MLGKSINIAIDGVSGCGKSSTAKAVAKILGMKYLDTGAMYRSATLYFIQRKIDIGNEDTLKRALTEIDIQIRYSKEKDVFEAYLNGLNVEEKIRSKEISDKVSEVSSLPEVRRFLIDKQREIALNGGVIMDGRDIGTNVMPDANLKIFMVADPEVRAFRRVRELKGMGLDTDFDEVLQNLISRDKYDSERELDPLKKAEDAVVIDTSNMDFNDQVGKIVKLAKELKENER